MDDWGWEQLRPWTVARTHMPIERCSASSTVRRAADLGRARRRGPSSGASRSGPASAGALLPIGYAMRTPSRWLVREFR